jgi:hypothetical protein
VMERTKSSTRTQGRRYGSGFTASALSSPW